MSISMILIPIAIGVKIAMGDNNYENWKGSAEIKMPTNFVSEEEVMISVKKAGYDITEHANILKTHIGKNGEYFIWENIDGVFTASFSKYNTYELIKTLIEDIEEVASRRVFYYSLDDMKLGEEARRIEDITESPIIDKEIFPTNFVKKDVLIKTLIDYGVNVKEGEEDSLKCSLDNYSMNFIKSSSGTYDLVIEGRESLRELYYHLNNLDQEYKLNSQGYTYQKVLEKVNKSNMRIEEEEILEDDSILLTIEVGGN